MAMADSFYPFVDSGEDVATNRHITAAQKSPFAEAQRAQAGAEAAAYEAVAARNESERHGAEGGAELVRYPARIAIYDDLLSTPRVIVVEPKDIRSYLEEITNTVNACVKEQGGSIPFMVIREIVENFIHAYFIEPTVSILDGGNTIRFADQGPGIANKDLALEAGMTSADEHMKRYIRGVGSGFPTVQQYLEMAGGKLVIEDNMNRGTVVTVTLDQTRLAGYGQASAAATPGAPQGDPRYAGAAPGAGPMPAGAGYGPPWGAPAYQPYPAPWPGAQAQTTPNAWQQPQGYGFPQSYPQAPQMFSTPPQPAETAMAAQSEAAPFISERGHLALGFLLEHGSCGPTELARAFGSSNPTWSRELATLAETGLVIKRGQKHFLTELGKTYAAR